jgi:hypothetical protein
MAARRHSLRCLYRKHTSSGRVSSLLSPCFSKSCGTARDAKLSRRSIAITPSPVGNVEACRVRQGDPFGNSATSFFIDVISKRQIQRADQSGAQCRSKSRDAKCRGADLRHDRTFDERLSSGQGRDVGHCGAAISANASPVRNAWCEVISTLWKVRRAILARETPASAEVGFCSQEASLCRPGKSWRPITMRALRILFLTTRIVRFQNINTNATVANLTCANLPRQECYGSLCL